MSEQQIKQEYLRKIGMNIGEECFIFSDKIETAEPYLVSLGNHVTIANDVMFATHDASANFYLEGVSGTIIIPSVTIADHCIIAAGSVITKSFYEQGKVIGGNPAKVIGSVEELKEKNKECKLMTWGMTFEEKKKYLIANEDKFKPM